MLDLPHLGLGGQQMVEVPAPSGRVLARAIAACLGPVEHSFHAPAHPRGRLGLLSPDRFEHLEHEPFGTAISVDNGGGGQTAADMKLADSLSAKHCSSVHPSRSAAGAATAARHLSLTYRKRSLTVSHGLR